VPIVPAAPSLFSTTICWPSRSESFCATMRADRIRVAAGLEADDELHGPRGIGLRIDREGRARDQRSQESCQHGVFLSSVVKITNVANHFHRVRRSRRRILRRARRPAGRKIAAHDVLLARPEGLQRLQERAGSVPVSFLPLREALYGARYVLSTVTTTVARAAAEQCAAYLQAGQT
jgi:hypothetical protein